MERPFVTPGRILNHLYHMAAGRSQVACDNWIDLEAIPM